MNRKKVKKEKKQQDILQAATDIFLNEGFLGASMDKIAMRAGVTKQTVYRYFESKEVLFQAVLEAQRGDIDSQFQQELDREAPMEALTMFSIGFLEMHMSESHLAVIRLLVAEGPRAPELTRAFFAVGPKKTKERLMEFFTTRFKVADPEYTVKMLLSTLLSLRMNVLVGLRPIPTKEELVHHAKRSIAVCIEGLVIQRSKKT